MENAFTKKVKQFWAFIKRTAVRVWKYLKVAKMEWIVMLSVFVLDLVSKALVENFMEYHEVVTLIPYVFNAHKVHNYNAAFGSSWLSSIMTDLGARIFFCVFAVAASVAFILVLIRQKGKSRVFRIAIALFVAGAMGNCIDRMVLGYVRDFIEFVYFGMTISGSKKWPYIFNIADVALISGVCLIVFYFIFLYRDNDKKKLGKEGDVSGEAIRVADNGEQTPDGQENVGESLSDNGETPQADGGADIDNNPETAASGDEPLPQENDSDTKDVGGDAL